MVLRSHNHNLLQLAIKTIDPGKKITAQPYAKLLANLEKEGNVSTDYNRIFVFYGINFYGTKDKKVKI